MRSAVASASSRAARSARAVGSGRPGVPAMYSGMKPAEASDAVLHSAQHLYRRALAWLGMHCHKPCSSPAPPSARAHPTRWPLQRRGAASGRPVAVRGGLPESIPPAGSRPGPPAAPVLPLLPQTPQGHMPAGRRRRCCSERCRSCRRRRRCWPPLYRHVREGQAPHSGAAGPAPASAAASRRLPP